MGLLTRRLAEEVCHIGQATTEKRRDNLNIVTDIFVIGFCQQATGEVTFSTIQLNGFFCWDGDSGVWSNKEHVGTTFGVLDFSTADHVGRIEREGENFRDAHGSCYS